jgi:hypothetical protein
VNGDSTLPAVASPRNLPRGVGDEIQRFALVLHAIVDGF